MSKVEVFEGIEKQEPTLWKQKQATRAVFFIGGFGAASWAPLVPFLKMRLAIGEDSLGLLLLCIGFGSLLTMPFSGVAAAKFGCRKVIAVAGVCYAVLLFFLSQIASFGGAMLALLLFGGIMGSIDVVVNIHAVMVEKAAKERLMSSMHALWSVGGFVGAGFFGFWLYFGFSPGTATFFATSIMLLLLLLCNRGLLTNGAGQGASFFAIPRGIVIFIGIICCIAFLVEGAIMDWSGVFLTTVRGLDLSMAGTGFAVFSAAMLTMRLVGDRLVQRLGSRGIVLGGSALAAMGFLLLIFMAAPVFVYAGFFCIGIGSANVVPVFFSLLGRQKIMPINMAVPAVSTLGYLGILMGPAAIGFLAHNTSLYMAFALLAVLIVLQGCIAEYVYKKLV